MPGRLSLIILGCLTAFGRTLYLANGSPCSSTCNSDKGTYYPDLVCSDDDFSTTSKGLLLKKCMECLSTSTYVNDTYTDGNTDQFWFLFHMKYIQQACLSSNNGQDHEVTEPCSSRCSGLHDPLEELWIHGHPFKSQYVYCSTSDSTYTQNADDCSSCLQANQGSVIVGNTITVMSSACNDKPMIQNGDLVPLNVNLFDATVSTSPSSAPSSASSSPSSPSSTSTASSAASTSSAAAVSSSSDKPTSTASSSTSSSTSASTAVAANNSSQDSDSNSKGGSGDLSLGAALGIGLGVGLVGLAAIVFGAVYFLQRKKSSPSPESSALVEKGAGTGIKDPLPYHSELEPKMQSRFVEAPDHHIHEADGGAYFPQVELEAPPYYR